MERRIRIKRQLQRLPAWILTVITLAAVLWLTLAPHPLGEQEPPPLFPGADKVVHAIMFGGLTFVALVDWARGRDFRSVRWPVYILMAALSSLLGIAIEFIQRSMGMGRSYDPMDMLADITGSFLVAVVWICAEACRKPE